MCVIDMATTYGYPREQWDAAKRELRAALWEAAKRGEFITYSDGVVAIRQFIVLHPHDSAFHHMLGQISVDEDAAGRGMLSALVVHMHGDEQPGPGFFDLAKSLGRDTRNRENFWVEEVKRLFGEASGVCV